MIKKIISIMRQDERKFKCLITRLGGSYYHTNHINNEIGYFAIEVLFDKHEQFDLLQKNMDSKNYEYYYPVEVED